MSPSNACGAYPIGKPGVRWDADDKVQWLRGQRIRRSYRDEVVATLQSGAPDVAEVFQYGELDYSRFLLGRYPLFAARSRRWNAGRPTLLVTGGVHGYETSGVQGALRFVEQAWPRHADAVNVLVLPCISPWGYETINRWNPDALDPNRQFVAQSPAAESALAMACVAEHGGRIDVHVDLHETTDTDNSEFGPAKAARDGVAFERHDIPDGFYLVADAARPEPAFQRTLIEAVRSVTPIAEPDAQGRIIGIALQQPGVVEMAKRASGLCGGMTDARYVATTEVYPDSPRTTPAECQAAQLAAVEAAIAYLLRSA